jgi:hypothetical protein
MMLAISFYRYIFRILKYIGYPMLPVSLDCPVLIVPLVFSNVYLYKFWFDVVDNRVKFFFYAYQFEIRIEHTVLMVYLFSYTLP